MSRANSGPRLELYGPDTRYGAKRRPTFRRYLWYIVWSEKGKKREQPAGVERVDGGETERRAAEAALEQFLGKRRTAEQSTGPRRPDQFPISEALQLYADEHGPSVADGDRIAYAMTALLDCWGEADVSAINKATCAKYARDRQARHLQRRTEQAAKVRARGTEPKEIRPLSTDTIRRELGVLQAALNHCVASGYLVSAPPVTLAEKGRSRDRWLTRNEVAKLVRAARQVKRAHAYLPHFILMLFYHGVRREAALSLQWMENTTSGHVDLERGFIDFQGAARRTKKERVLVPIAERMWPFLRVLKRRNSPYVFGRFYEGKWRPIGNPNKGIAAAADAAGLGHVTCHTLRHTAITNLVQEGVALWEVAGWVGTSPEMIDRHYGHHSPHRFKGVQRAHRGSR